MVREGEGFNNRLAQAGENQVKMVESCLNECPEVPALAASAHMGLSLWLAAPCSFPPGLYGGDGSGG